MAQGKAHDREKVARVLADLYLNAESRDTIAEKNDVSPTSVTDIKRRYFADFDRVKNETPDGSIISALATGLVIQSLVTLRLQMELFGDTDWLQRQSAGDLAILSGVLSDKTIRLLAAAQRASDAEGRPPAGERQALDGVGAGDVP